MHLQYGIKKYEAIKSLALEYKRTIELGENPHKKSKADFGVSFSKWTHEQTPEEKFWKKKCVANNSTKFDWSKKEPLFLSSQNSPCLVADKLDKKLFTSHPLVCYWESK